MKVIFTCGGTAGHVNPALALAQYMQERIENLDILFVGTPDGMERGLVEQAGYAFRGVEVGGFCRSLAPSGIRHNLKSVEHLLAAKGRVRAILRDFPADLVVGTGGYASYPITKYAAQHGIPTAVHESNMVPGLTTKMLEGYVDCVMVGFEECRQHYKHPQKVVVTGTPVRGDFFTLTRAQAREKLGLTDERPLVASFWGSLGASGMNEQMLRFFEREIADGQPFHHIHAAGKSGWALMESEPAAQQYLHRPGLDIRRYIDNRAEVMRAADLVICRAGSPPSAFRRSSSPRPMSRITIRRRTPASSSSTAARRSCSRRTRRATRSMTPRAAFSTIRKSARPCPAPWRSWASPTRRSGSSAP